MLIARFILNYKYILGQNREVLNLTAAGIAGISYRRGLHVTAAGIGISYRRDLHVYGSVRILPAIYKT